MKLLVRAHERLPDAGLTEAVARKAWKAAGGTRERVAMALRAMASGIERCMYCSESLGTAIDHFEPLNHAPRRVFDWYNHLLACSFCNSHAKGGTFPKGTATGEPLLIDPTAEEPAHHLRLSLTSGEYHCLTPRGCATIDVFQLNRGPLRKGRLDAVGQCLDTLAGCAALLAADDTAGARKRMLRLRRQPLADVLQELRRIADRPSAAVVLGDEAALEALRALYGQPVAKQVFIPQQTSRHQPDCRFWKTAPS
ncbi:HNH endonuclease [Streptomyces javensis]|uniref:HNH endonuclease n=1 Tax=Streptomyces javensis TaxID=114698 RepID=UPI0031F9A49F